MLQLSCSSVLSVVTFVFSDGTKDVCAERTSFAAVRTRVAAVQLSLAAVRIRVAACPTKLRSCVTKLFDLSKQRLQLCE